MTGPRVGNIYHMLAYAFQNLRQIGPETVDAEEFENLHDLLAEVLVRGVDSQLRRGLHRDYITAEDELSGIRGQIRVGESIKRQVRLRGHLTCAFDEFSVNEPPNQVLKSVVLVLLRHGRVSQSRKQGLRRLVDYLGEVGDIDAASIRWGSFRFDRNNATYRMLMGICRLVVEGLLLTQRAGEHRLAAWLDDARMSRLYERFVREYFRFHHPEFGACAEQVPWDSEGVRTPSLPRMLTDVTLRFGGRTLIIDTKWYSHTMQTHPWADHETFLSANLYQIFSYVKNADPNRTGSVAGALLYAKTDEAATPNDDLVLGGNLVMLRTLDLNQPWASIVDQLEALTKWLRPTGPIT